MHQVDEVHSTVIDLHTHILPGVDDGARDLEESVRMLELAVADGITTIVATPHHQGARPVAREDVDRGVEALTRCATDRNLALSVVAGAEVMLTPDLSEWRGSLRSLCLNQSRYMLVEMPLQFKPLYTDYVLDYLQSAGIRVILAHAERYEWIQRDANAAKRLVANDVLLQVNSGSVVGEAGPGMQRSARDLLARGLVSFLASDAHSSRRRVPKLSRAREIVAGLIGSEAADAMVMNNPSAVLSDAAELPPAPRISRNRVYRFLPTGWFRFTTPLIPGRRSP